ncbi:MAG: hypothetical protein ACREME_11970 [Gemmatimonadales bacterium]
MTQRVLLHESSNSSFVGSADQAWKWVGWLGVVLTVVGGGDFLLGWYPLRFGVLEWEFATVAATFAGLPLVSLGFAALLAAGVARGVRWLVYLAAWAMLLFAAVIAAAFVVFLTDVPLALKAVTGDAALGIKKAIAKTTMLAVTFAIAYVVAGLGALRHLRTRGRSGHA